MNTTCHYPRHRFPIDVISQCVWLYFRFCLSYRDVEEMMAERGVTVSYETIRVWCDKFGQEYTRRLRRQRGCGGDTWHLDEVYLRIDGRFQYLWRAVDQEGEVLDILVQPRRDKGANNRAENSHQPTRERERRRRRFRSSGEAQRFLSTFSTISNHFRSGRH